MLNDQHTAKKLVAKFRSRDHLRHEVVEAARKMFLERGVERSGMTEIAHAVGLSKPTIYEVFSNKQSLIDAVFDAAVKDADLSWIAAALQSPIRFDEFLEQTCDAYKRMLRAPKSTEGYQLVINEGVYSTSLLEAFAKYVAGPSASALQCIVAAAMQRDECREMNVQVVQKQIVAPMYFLISDRVMFGDHGMSSDIAEQYLEQSFAALKTHLCIAAH